MKVAFFIETPAALSQVMEERFTELDNLVANHSLEKVVLAVPEQLSDIAQENFSNNPFIEVRSFQLVNISASHAKASNEFFQIPEFHKASTRTKWTWPVDNATDFLDCALWLRLSTDIFSKGVRPFFPIVPIYILGGCSYPRTSFENSLLESQPKVRSIIQTSAGFLTCGCESRLFREALKSAPGLSIPFECECLEGLDRELRTSTGWSREVDSLKKPQINQIGVVKALNRVIEEVTRAEK